MATGSHLKIRKMADTVLGVDLKGSRSNPEPETFRVTFPGGDVDIVRTSDDQYWVHVRVNHPKDGGYPDRVFGQLVDGRMDVIGKHVQDVDCGDIENPDLAHIAVRIGLNIFEEKA